MRGPRAIILLVTSSLLTLLVGFAWLNGAMAPPQPMHIASGDTFWRDGFEWRHHYVIRMRPQRLVFEWWTVPPARDGPFDADVRTSVNHAIQADSGGGPIAWDAYAAGRRS